jgi:glutamate/tyrosine decarboxylase-like PLP-dependent enzyme
MVSFGSYFDHAAAARDEMDWNPEWSRRARGLAVYAAIRSLGRKGVEELVDRCCARAARLVAEIGALPGAEVVEPPLINQGLVRFLDAGGDHDRRTDEVIARVQALGEAWFGGAACRGQRVMRVSVSNWRTSDEDVDRAVASVRAALAGA